MKSKKLLLFFIIAISALLILSGCSNASISLRLSPNPVEFSDNQIKEELTLEVKTEGIGSISLDKMIVEVFNQNNEVIFYDQKDIDISDQSIVGGFSDTVDYTLDLEKIFNPADYGSYVSFASFYNDVLAGKEHSLNITVTGSSTISLITRIIYYQ